MSSTLSSSLDAEVASGQVQQAKTADSRKAIFAISLGNGLEMYDFTVYSFFAVIIGELFFNVGGAAAGLLLSLATFGVGFVMRPLGAVMIGNYADKYGRKAALTLTITLMTVGTGMIALTPTYESIGIAATIILVVGRLLQGLSAGGEIGTASAALMESDNYQRRCYMVSWQIASQGAAALVGALVGFAVNGLLSAEEVHSWGWRIPFVLGLLIGPVGWYIRRHLNESHQADPKAQDTPFKTVLSKQGGTILTGMLMIWGGTACMYIEVFYMPTYLIKELGYSSTTAFAVAVMAGLMLMVLMPVFGKWADRLASRKTLPLLGMFGSFLFIYPAFTLLGGDASVVKALLVIGVLIALFALSNASLLVLIMEAFSQQYRASGISMIYGFGVTVFGGFTPLLVASLIEWSGNKMAPAFYLMFAIVVSCIAMGRFPAKAVKS
ncbi:MULTISPECIES: MFS transporter [Vibrio]|uniref:MFS transporter n=1 Tax=Vibrio ostreae TaxID=2841925 RepID=A0A975U7W9_9VIBR|nr:MULTISPECIES: MFS transporter [Vibrio]QXO16763.1 MFS transporter [Vibrio ostreae]WGY46256.1 MFS transporter [Vibrio sp. ABG19]